MMMCDLVYRKAGIEAHSDAVIANAWQHRYSACECSSIVVDGLGLGLG